jgi:hypothetical protein
MIPRLDLFELKAKLEDSARVFEMQLKRAVFPVLVMPMMPQFNAIFFCKDTNVNKLKTLNLRLVFRTK